MPSDNPFQSPESESASEELVDNVGDNVIATRSTTWRFWVMALLGPPAMTFPLFFIVLILQENVAPYSLWWLLLLAVTMLAIYLTPIIVFVRNLHPGPRTNALSSDRRDYALGGLIVLSLIAVPSAFFSTCTPIAIGGGSWAYGH